MIWVKTFDPYIIYHTKKSWEFSFFPPLIKWHFRHLIRHMILEKDSKNHSRILSNLCEACECVSKRVPFNTFNRTDVCNASRHLIHTIQTNQPQPRKHNKPFFSRPVATKELTYQMTAVLFFFHFLSPPMFRTRGICCADGYCRWQHLFFLSLEKCDFPMRFGNK